MRLGRRQQRHIVIGSSILLLLGCLIWLGGTLNAGGDFTIDSAALLAIHSHTTPVIDAIVVHTTDMAGPMIVVGVGLLVGAVLLSRKKYSKGALVWAMILGAAALVYSVKLFIERPRPSLWSAPLVHETGFSFVSGHATMSVTLALAIIVVVWRTRWKWLAIIAGAVYCVYVAFTRLYLGVHYPTDIVGGWMLATAWVLCVVEVNTIVKNRIARRTRPSVGAPSSPRSVD